MHGDIEYSRQLRDTDSHAHTGSMELSQEAFSRQLRDTDSHAYTGAMELSREAFAKDPSSPLDKALQFVEKNPLAVTLGTVVLAAGTFALTRGKCSTGLSAVADSSVSMASNAAASAQRFAWGGSTAEAWNESNLMHVDTSKLLGELASKSGVGRRVAGDVSAGTKSAVRDSSVSIATDAHVAGGIPINNETRSAMQNIAILGMHPARRLAAASAAEGWSESNLSHVDVRKLLGQFTSVNGVGLRESGDASAAIKSVVGDSSVSLATDAQMGRGIPIGNENVSSVSVASNVAKSAERFDWGKSTAEGWNESNLKHVDTRKLLGQITSVKGAGLRVLQDLDLTSEEGVVRSVELPADKLE